MTSEKDYTLVLAKKLFGPSFDMSKFAMSGRRSNDGPLNLVKPSEADAETPIYSLLSNDEELTQVQVNDKLFLSKADHDKLVLHCRICLIVRMAIHGLDCCAGCVEFCVNTTQPLFMA